MSVGKYFDFNDTEGFRGVGQLIPAGTYVRVKMHIRPGDSMGPEESDGLILKSSSRSDAKYLDCEFTIMFGPYAKQKFWENWTIIGGRVDEKGDSIAWNITKSKFRSILDSGLGLDPDDKSQEMMARRATPGFKSFDGAEFAARIDVQPGGKNDATGGNYPDKNIIGAFLTVKDKELYQKVMAGEQVAPLQTAQTATAPTGTPANVRTQPAWGSGSAQAQTPWAGGGNGTTQAQPQAAPKEQTQPQPNQRPAWLK